MARNSNWKKNWKPSVKYTEPPWDIAEKHDEMIDLLQERPWHLVELQEKIGVTPTEAEKKASGKYGHVMGVTYLIQMARRNGWPVKVINYHGKSVVGIPREK